MEVRIIIFSLYCFIFQPQFTLDTILHWFQMYNEVAGNHAVYKTPSLRTPTHFTVPGTHLALYPVISTLLTVFPTLQSESLWLFCNHQFALFNPITSFTQSPTLAHGGSWLSCSENHWESIDTSVPDHIGVPLRIANTC